MPVKADMLVIKKTVQSNIDERPLKYLEIKRSEITFVDFLPYPYTVTCPNTSTSDALISTSEVPYNNTNETNDR